ncbi:MAG TPA: PadR family transcriptional regulator [Candidatus Acidoferrales bacterium]
MVEIHELDNWRAQLRKGALELVVLSALANGERYGLAVVEDLRRALGEEISEGTVYPLLNRLKQNGWLRSRWEESEAGHPRKYYSLTVEGARQLGRMLAEWEELSRRMGDHLAATTSRPPGREK